MMPLLEIYKIVLHKEVINLPSEWHWGVFTNILGIYQIEKSSEKWDSETLRFLRLSFKLSDKQHI